MSTKHNKCVYVCECEEMKVKMKTLEQWEPVWRACLLATMMTVSCQLGNIFLNIEMLCAENLFHMKW